MSTTEAPTEKPKGLYTKLAEVMGEVGRVPKNGYNDFHKYKFVQEDDLLEAVRQHLSDRQVMLLPSVASVQRDGTLTTVGVAFKFVDAETGEAHTCEWFGTGDDKGDKGLYKAYTGALKFFLMKSFLIPTGNDPEKTDKRPNERPKATNGGPPPVAISEDTAKMLRSVAQASTVPPPAVTAWLKAHGGSIRKLTPAAAEEFSLWLEQQSSDVAADTEGM